MPYNLNSLGQWMSKRTNTELSFTVGYSPMRAYNGGPKGRVRRLHVSIYHERYGIQTREAHPERGHEDYLRMGLVTDGNAMYVFYPPWAKRLPLLCKQKDIYETILAAKAGDNVFPGTGTLSAQMPTLYDKANKGFDYWWSKDHSAYMDPFMCFAQYAVTDEVKEESGLCWRKLTSPWVQHVKMTGDPPWPRFPEERKSSLGSYESEVYVTEESLQVLGHSKHEWNTIYRFYILEWSAYPMVAVLDRRCNVIVALLAGKVFEDKK